MEVFYVFAELLENLICNNGFHDIKSYYQGNIIRFPIMSIRLTEALDSLRDNTKRIISFFQLPRTKYAAGVA